jgi:predicted Zn finger-like uncharacterized protein
MFTQCPECNTAFRVTAEVLKRAAGQVRCGGCGIAFNALEHLSEERPKSAPWAKPNERAPELTPETDNSADSLPKSISAEQSAALLKTLDELAGSNIKIEDTGVEWRVLDSDSSDDEPDPEEQKAAESQLIADTGALKFVLESDDDGPATDASDIFESPGATFIDSNLESDSGDSIIDEFLTESPTPIDEFLTQTPSRVESPEVFADVGTTPDVMRFDDNTPLPDDFDLGDSAPYVPEPPPVEPVASVPEDADPQADLALGDPDEWELLLGEVDESTAEESDEEEIDEAISSLDEDSIEKELRSIADGAAGNDAGDTPLDMDTQFAIQAEAMGIDLSGMHKSVTDNEDNEDNDATGIDEPDAEPQDDDSDNEQEAATLIADSGDSGEDELELDPEPDEIPDDDRKYESDEEPDENSDNEHDESEEEPEEEQLDIAAVAVSDDAGNDSEFYRTLVEDLEAIDDAPDEGLLAFEDQDLDEEPEIGELELASDDNPEDRIDDLAEEGLEAGLDDESEDDADAETDEETNVDEPEISIDEDLIAAAFESEAAQQSADASEEEEDEISGEHYVPPQTEEEMTINMMIDQDFMRLAAEGEDIFTPTVVDDRSEPDETQNVETIIMEGEFVRTALDRENLAADAAAGSRRFDDTKFSPEPASDKTPGLRGGRRFGDPAGTRIIAGTVVLALILLVQILHQSREALATVPMFNQAIGPIYRTIGSPLTPDWNVAGWRFEVTKGSTDENDELLTIYSRIGNTSDGSLPYPLVHVSLTDRFEEIIGSKVLDPRDYLAGNPDPSKAVESGSTFNAVISIASPAAEATGFKLNVCYRLANRRLRCAIEDFK